MRRVPLGIAVTFLLAACGGGKQDQSTAAADSAGMALAQYSPAAFDTISWASDSAAVNRGATVWEFSCQRCHGQTGAGDAHFVTQVKDSTGKMVNDTLKPPSFLQPGWQYATDKQALIKFIYTGSATRPMPHWGVEKMRLRDIDAVATYIQQVVAAPKPNEQKPDSAPTQ